MRDRKLCGTFLTTSVLSVSTHGMMSYSKGVLLLDSNLTDNLNELKDSCRLQSEELKALSVQRDKLHGESAVNEGRKHSLVNDSTQEKPTPAATSQARDMKKRAKKEEFDLGIGDETLQVEDLEPAGVAATKVSLRCRCYEYFQIWGRGGDWGDCAP